MGSESLGKIRPLGRLPTLSHGSTRGRLVAIAFLALMISSAFSGVVPTASAARTVSGTPTLTWELGGTAVETLPATTVAKIDDIVTVSATLSLTHQTTECTTAPKGELWADVRFLNTDPGDANGYTKIAEDTPTVSQQGDFTAPATWKYDFTADLTVAAALLSSNGTAFALSAFVTTLAAPVGQPTCNAFTSNTLTAPGQLKVDNFAPQANIDIAIAHRPLQTGVTPTGAIVIGDTIFVNLSGVVDASIGTIDARSLGTVVVDDITPANGFTKSYLVSNTTETTPFIVRLSDANGNPITKEFPVGTVVDASKPVIVPIETTSKLGGSIHVKFVHQDTTHITEGGSAYNITIHEAGTPTSSDRKLCVCSDSDPNTPPILVSEEGGVIELNLTDSPFTFLPSPNTVQHTITIVPTDLRGNVGDPITTTVAPARAPSTITISVPTSTSNVWPTVTGTWTSTSSITNHDTSPIIYYVQAVSGPNANKYWTGEDNGFTDTFEQRGKFQVNDLLTTNGASDTSGTYTFKLSNNSAVYKIPNGTYKFFVDFVSSTPISTAGSTSFTYDWSRPPVLTFNLPTTASASWPVVTGTWTSSDIVANHDTSRIVYSVLNSAGEYWTGTDGTFAAGVTTFPMDDVVTSNGASDFAGTFRFQLTGPGAVYKIPNGTYTFAATYTSSGPPVTATSPQFAYDWKAPTLSGVSTENKVTSPADGMTQQGSAVTIRLDLKDETAGFAAAPAVTFKLVNATTKVPVRDFTGANFAQVSCPASCTLTPSAGSTSTYYRANVTLAFPSPILGPYLVNVSFADRAGNAFETTLTTPTLFLQPRVAIGRNADDFPSINENGLMFRAYAGYENLTSTDPAQTCASNTCRVTTLEIYGRNSSVAPTTALGGATTPLLYHSEQPLDTTPTPQITGDTRLYYDFSKSAHGALSIAELRGLNTSSMFIRALVKVQTGTSFATNMTDWIRVRTNETPSALTLRPIDNGTVFMLGQKGSVTFNATYEQSGLEFVPRVNYTIRQVRTPAGPLPEASQLYYRFENATLTTSSEPSWINVSAAQVGSTPPTGPLYRFNWTNNATLPPGEYILNVSIRGPEIGTNNATLLKSVERLFAVENTGVAVHMDDANLKFAQPEIYQGRYTPMNFNVSFLVDHGFANLTAAPNKINLTLRASNTAVGATGYRIIQSGSETFTATLRDLNFNPENRSTYGNFTVKLPDNATDGTRYDLIVNVQTDSAFNGGGGAAANATTLRLIDIDLSPPNVGIYLDLSTATGANRAAELRVIGFAVDASSGVRAVETRVFDKNGSRTFDPLANFGQGGWVSGDQPIWLSSDAVNTNDDEYARNVELVTLSNGTSEWQVHDSAAQRRVIRFASIDNITGSSQLGFGRNYELTINNISGAAGSTWYLFSPSGVVKGIAPSIVDTPRGKINVTFRNVTLEESGTWRANISSSGTNPTTFSVAPAAFTVNDGSSRTEKVLKAITTVNDMTGLPVSGTPFTATFENLNGTTTTPWYLYAPAGLGRGESFASTPTTSVLPVADTANPGKVKIVLTSFTFETGGVWRFNESGKPGDSNATFFNIPRGNFGPLGLDRNNTYDVSVRGADRISAFGAISNATIAFDVTPPVVNIPLAGPGALLNWHDTRSFTVNASDNNCVAAVNLIVKTPQNTTLSPLPFAGPYNATGVLGTPAACVPGPLQWRFSLAANPVATGEVGNYTYAVEVIDSAGIALRDPRTINATVQDTQSPVLEFIYSEPPIAQIGTSITLRLRYFENFAMNQVVVNLTKRNELNQIIGTFPEVAAHPAADVAANGTGNYSVSTSADFGIENLTAGNYQWVVHAKDTNSAVTCISPGCPPAVWITRVTSDAPAFITVDSPTTGASFINATPTFVWRVLDKSVTASGIRVEAGATNATRTTVTPVIEALPKVANQSTGYRVTYAPPRINESTYSVSITAAASTPVSSTQNYNVDGIAPVVLANLTGALPLGDRVYAVAATRVSLSAADNESTVAALGYSVNGGSAQTYTVPILPQGPDGEWRLDYFARDAAGNLATGTLSLQIDTTGPSIRVAKHGDEVLLTVTDAGVGLDADNVTVHYAYGNATTFSTAKLSTVTANSFRALLPGNSSTTGLRYYFDAKDKLGNVGTNFSAAAPYVILPAEKPVNNPPTLSITSPLPNTKVRNSVALNWIAADPENDPIAITIALRDPSGTGDFLVRGGENSGGYIVDVTTKASGSYTLVVTASDGENSAQQSVLFTVERGLPVQCVACPSSTVDANRQVTVSIQVNPVGKTVAKVAYNVTRDDQQVVVGDMKLSQGTWTATLVPTESGNYKMFVTPTYSDGSSDAPREITAFAVTVPRDPIAGPTVFPAGLILLLVLGVLTVALASYGAFVRWR